MSVTFYRRQQKGETVKHFHSVLRSLAEYCQPGALEVGLLRDIFTANMINSEIQKELLKVTMEPEKALELAISIELGARSQLAIQANNTTDPSMLSIVERLEPVLAISCSRYSGNNKQPRGSYNQSNRQQFQQQRDKNIWWSRKKNSTNLRSFTNPPLRNVGTT